MSRQPKRSKLGSPPSKRLGPTIAFVTQLAFVTCAPNRLRRTRLQVKPTLDGQGGAMPIHEVRLRTFDPKLDSQRLRDWLRRAHVARWWGEPQQQLENLLRCSRETQTVIVADGTPVGYLCWQKPPQDELEAAGLTDLPEDLVDIDIMIGESKVVGQGVGPRALRLLLNRSRADPLVSFAGVATSVSNERAIRAFEKAGFRLFREFQDPESGPCRYMVVEIHDAV